jgi:hypothetical protein
VLLAEVHADNIHPARSGAMQQPAMNGAPPVGRCRSGNPAFSVSARCSRSGRRSVTCPTGRSARAGPGPSSAAPIVRVRSQATRQICELSRRSNDAGSFDHRAKPTILPRFTPRPGGPGLSALPIYRSHRFGSSLRADAFGSREFAMLRAARRTVSTGADLRWGPDRNWIPDGSCIRWVCASPEPGHSIANYPDDPLQKPANSIAARTVQGRVGRAFFASDGKSPRGEATTARYGARRQGVPPPMTRRRAAGEATPRAAQFLHAGGSRWRVHRTPITEGNPHQRRLPDAAETVVAAFSRSPFPPPPPPPPPCSSGDSRRPTRSLPSVSCNEIRGGSGCRRATSPHALARASCASRSIFREPIAFVSGEERIRLPRRASRHESMTRAIPAGKKRTLDLLHDRCLGPGTAERYSNTWSSGVGSRIPARSSSSKRARLLQNGRLRRCKLSITPCGRTDRNDPSSVSTAPNPPRAIEQRLVSPGQGSSRGPSARASCLRAHGTCDGASTTAHAPTKQRAAPEPCLAAPRAGDPDCGLTRAIGGPTEKNLPRPTRGKHYEFRGMRIVLDLSDKDIRYFRSCLQTVKKGALSRTSRWC